MNLLIALAEVAGVMYAFHYAADLFIKGIINLGVWAAKNRPKNR